MLFLDSNLEMDYFYLKVVCSQVLTGLQGPLVVNQNSFSCHFSTCILVFERLSKGYNI